MLKVTLHIQNPYERRDFDLGDEVTIGRTDVSGLVVSDSGLSRRNTTIFRDGNAVIVVDEGSLNGVYFRIRGTVEIAPGDTFLAGEQVFRLEPTPKASDGADQPHAGCGWWRGLQFVSI